jgi:hypothetical protein
MKLKSTTLVAALILATSLSAPPAFADGLLGGVLGGGGSGGGLLSIDRGSAGDSSTVNIGLGSDSNSPDNIADVNLGNANANVSGGNGQGGLLNNGGLLGTGLLDGDDDGGVLGSGILGSNLTAGIDLGGLSLDLTIPGLDDLLGGGGDGNGPGNGPGNGNGNGNGGGRTLVGSIEGGFQVNCSLDDGRRVLQLASQAAVNPRSWSSAANVQIVPIRLCPEARGQVAQIFRASGKIQQLQSAVAADALIVASLNRSRHDIGDVFAVEARGGSLTVYVY